MDQYVLQPSLDDTVLRDEPGDEADRPHLPHQRRIEADLVDAVQNIICGVRHVFAEQRIDMNDDNVGAGAVIDEREECRISHVAAVPIGFAVDLNRMKHRGQTRRSHHGGH